MKLSPPLPMHRAVMSVQTGGAAVGSPGWNPSAISTFRFGKFGLDWTGVAGAASIAARTPDNCTSGVTVHDGVRFALASTAGFQYGKIVIPSVLPIATLSSATHGADGPEDRVVDPDPAASRVNARSAVVVWVARFSDVGEDTDQVRTIWPSAPWAPLPAFLLFAPPPPPPPPGPLSGR